MTLEVLMWLILATAGFAGLNFILLLALIVLAKRER